MKMNEKLWKMSNKYKCVKILGTGSYKTEGKNEIYEQLMKTNEIYENE